MIAGYPSPEQVAASMQGAQPLSLTSRLLLDPLWQYRTGNDMGSWLSDLTGIHISTKGVSLSAPKIPSAFTGKPKAPSVPTIAINTAIPTPTPVTSPVVVNTAPATGVPTYTTPVVTGTTPASSIPGATTAVLPDGSQIPVVPTGAVTGKGLSAPGPLGIPMYGWLAIGAGTFLLLNNSKR